MTKHAVAPLNWGQSSSDASRRLGLASIGVLFASLLTGCLQSDPPDLRPCIPPRQDRLMIHDAGNVLAGESVSHRFVFRNPFAESITIQNDVDIQKSCGCSSVDVLKHHLAPGEETIVRVEVSTIAKRGKISEIISIKWASQHSDPVEYAFAIRANVQSALVLKPAELSFSRDEVARGVAKTVVCESDLPIDWTSAKVENSGHRIKIHRRHSDDHGCQFDVVCQRASNGQAHHGELEIVASGLRETECEPPTFTNLLPVYWLSPAQLSISPSLITFRQDAGKWRTWFVLTGDSIKSGARTREITISSQRVSFAAQQLGPARSASKSRCHAAPAQTQRLRKS